MAFAPTLKTWLLVLPAVAVLGVAGYRASGHAAGVASPSPDLPTVVASRDSGAALPVVPEALARRLATVERGNTLPSGLPLDLRADIEDASDLYAYAQRLRVQADTGNHEARWMLSRVYDYCAQYALDPGGYRLDNNVLSGLGLTAAPAMIEARERVAQRCGGFVPGDKLGAALVLAERRKAARRATWPQKHRCSPRVSRCMTVPSTAATWSSACVLRVTRRPIWRSRRAWACVPPVTAHSTVWWRANSSVSLHGGLRPANSVYRVERTACWSTVFVRTEGSVRRMERRISGISCMTLRYRGKVLGK